MESRDRIARILSNIPIFRGMSGEAVNSILDIMKLTEFETDTMVIQQGTEGDTMYIIKSGSVKVVRLEESSQEALQLAILQDGEYFGELSLIDSMPRSANVITVEKSEILKLSKTDFDKLLNAQPEIASLFYRNCLQETTSRFRNIISQYTFTNHDLRMTSSQLDEINKDLSFAQKIQDYLINRDYLNRVKLKNAKLTYIYNPCIAIGGDFLNVVTLDEENVGIILADVTGHGITSALVTGVVKSGFMMFYEGYGSDPPELLRLLSEHLTKVIARLFATCYYGVLNLETREIRLSNAGHHHPFLYRAASRSMETIECRGPGLGMIPGAKFNEISVTLEKGDKIMLFSDGVIEQIDEHHVMYGKQRFLDDFFNLCLNGEENVLEILMNHVKEFAGEVPIQDDITLILIEF